MLLQPLEEQLNLPSVMIELCDHHWADIQRVSEENALPLLLFVSVDDAPDLLRIPEAGLLAVHVSDGIGQDTGIWGEAPRPPHRFEVVVLLAPDNEVGPDDIDPEQSFEVIVTTVEDVERVLFIRDDIHSVHIVHPGFRDVEERRDGGLKVVQCMYFDPAFPLVLPEDGPFECLQAEFDSR